MADLNFLEKLATSKSVVLKAGVYPRKSSMPSKTVADWEAEGWKAVSLRPGVPVNIDCDPVSEDIVVKGMVYGSDGNQIIGHDHPKVGSKRTKTGRALIQPDKAVGENVTVVYKIVPQSRDLSR
jgi:hypothetical protein